MDSNTSITTNFARQQSLNLKIPNSIAVVGCGGVGSWVAYFLALAGVSKLWLFDGDIVEDHNLNRLPFPASSSGKRKSVATCELISTVRTINCIGLGNFSTKLAEQLDLGRELEWIIAATDTLASRQDTFKWATRSGISYIEAAAEGEVGSATDQPAEWRTPEEDNPGYASVPVWVGPCVSSALIAVSYVLHNRRMGDRVIRLGWEEDHFLTYDSIKEKR